MSKFSGFPLNKITLLLAIVGGFLFFTSEANAQEENSPRPTEKPLVDDQTVNQDFSTGAFPLFKPTQKTTSLNSIGPKRDLPAGGFLQEKDSKKNESPSTLSFNIFLYIVDKFKED
ncbi:MAG: hypothetical protein MUE75_05455 [Algoriphagus sp.]|jgi:hypothetical protein|nr:hypothetical protein [Algoriphagus sp.]